MPARPTHSPLTLAAARARNPGAGVPSPCISACKLDQPAKSCLSCRRTVDEITNWRALPDAKKLAVWKRLASLPAPRGNR